MIGCDEQEIADGVRSSFDLNLVEELEQLAAAKRLTSSAPTALDNTQSPGKPQQS